MVGCFLLPYPFVFLRDHKDLLPFPCFPLPHLPPSEHPMRVYSFGYFLANSQAALLFEFSSSGLHVAVSARASVGVFFSQLSSSESGVPLEARNPYHPPLRSVSLSTVFGRSDMFSQSSYFSGRSMCVTRSLISLPDCRPFFCALKDVLVCQFP